MKPAWKVYWTILIAALFVFACSPAPTPPSLPTDATLPPPAATSVPFYLNLTLNPTDKNETGQDPADYTVAAQIPTLTGSDDPRVTAFNALAASIVQQGVDEFKSTMTDLQPLPDIGAASGYTLKYTSLSAQPGYVSIKFESEGYVEGMAHPYHVSRSLNYDLETGEEISLDSLFTSDSSYLQVIADYCAAQLQTRDIGFTDIFTDGAKPAAENYQVWNITPDGLLITFNEYQVAPYAAGPQTVLVPYAELASIINPQGALAGYLP